jgi:hypothetical protein
VNGNSWKMASYPNNKALLQGGSIKEICGMFGYVLFRIQYWGGGGSIDLTVLTHRIETIILWNALVLKKRVRPLDNFVFGTQIIFRCTPPHPPPCQVAVVCDKLPQLLSVLRTLPQFVWHRQDWSFLRPYCTLADTDLKELQIAGVFCAGFLEPESSGIRSKEVGFLTMHAIK